MQRYADEVNRIAYGETPTDSSGEIELEPEEQRRHMRDNKQGQSRSDEDDEGADDQKQQQRPQQQKPKVEHEEEDGQGYWGRGVDEEENEPVVERTTWSTSSLAIGPNCTINVPIYVPEPSTCEYSFAVPIGSGPIGSELLCVRALTSVLINAG
jgi:hypothetical protein